MNFRTIITLAVLMLATIGWTGPCSKSKFPVSDMAKEAIKGRGVPASRNLLQTAPCGAGHYGTVAVSDAQLAAICQGLEQRQQAAFDDGFRPEARKDGAFFHIFTPPVPCVLSPIQQIPSFMVNGGRGYDGTEWDQYNPKGPGVKDGQSAVFAAEFILNIGTPGSTWDGQPYPFGAMYLCPDLSVVAEATGNGFDHIYLANFAYSEKNRVREPYDGWTWFNGTLIHGPGHPLLLRGGRLVEAGVAARTTSDAPAASVITTAEIPDDTKDEAMRRGLSTDGVQMVDSSTAIIRAVK